jgi:hypothetical protein
MASVLFKKERNPSFLVHMVPVGTKYLDALRHMISLPAVLIAIKEKTMLLIKSRKK